jgi:DNA invertase Pin-like site-specific DNA recombinase
MTTTPLRAAIYARFSTERQRQESATDQFRVCERHAERLQMEVVGRYGDEGISGGTTKRPGYQAMLAAARRKEFNASSSLRIWVGCGASRPSFALRAEYWISAPDGRSR